MGAFLSYLFLTSFWSTVPERSVEQAFRLTLLTLFGLAGFSMLRSHNDTQKQRVTECLIPALIVGIVTGCIYGLLQYTGVYIRILTDFLGLSDELSIFYAENRLHVAKTMLLTNFAFLPFFLGFGMSIKSEHFSLRVILHGLLAFRFSSSLCYLPGRWAHIPCAPDFLQKCRKNYFCRYCCIFHNCYSDNTIQYFANTKRQPKKNRYQRKCVCGSAYKNLSTLWKNEP